MISFLRGDAFRWAQPYVRDHVMHHNATTDSRKVETRNLIDDTDTFVARMEELFGGLDKDMVANKVLPELKQRKSVSGYRTEFQSYAIRTNYDEASLINYFYQGLKDNVKDELYRMPKLVNDSLAQL